ncbi:MAG: C10 family peptidase [Bacteroidota bacterium]
MKKRLFLQVLFVSILSSTFAKNITEQQAIFVGKNFYYPLLNIEHPTDFKDINVDNITKKIIGGKTLYYIINFTYQGFIIVSGNDAVKPILCYSFTSRYSDIDQPPAFMHWMQDYEKQLVYVNEQNIQATQAIAAEWQSLLSPLTEQLKNKNGTKTVAPLLHSTWDQGKYYNDRCPVDVGGTDGKCWAGCVPTAMGQIMNYYQYPAHGVGSYSYVHPTYGILSTDFSNTTYYWGNMPLKVTERQNDSAVANLLYQLGVSVDLNYGPDGSGMFNHKAAFALRTNFNYSPLCEYIFRDTASHTNWKQLILDHLNQKKPLYYAGWADTINVSGHAFVCDGYQDTSYFHFNWGWSGQYDGYFLLDNLNPGGNNFTLDHELILNFFPDSSADYPTSCPTNMTLKGTKGTLSDGSGPLYKYKDNADCYWLIQPDDSVINIKLTFLEFNTEADSDKVIVYNGATIASPVLGTFSGSSLPSVITSTGKSLLVRFISNDTISADGWLAEYTTTTPVYCSGITQFTAASGSFSDGSGSFNYHPNELCRWQIYPTGATSVLLHFNSFDIGEGDYVQVNDITNSILLANLSGSVIPDDIVCNSGQMLVMFKTYDKIMAQGFSADYTVSNSLQDNNTLASKIIVSPIPAQDNLTITFESQLQQELNLEIFSLEGSIVYSNLLTIQTGNTAQTIDVSNLISGLYVLKISSNLETVYKKLILV